MSSTSAPVHVLGTATLTGIGYTTGNCEACGRELTQRVFQVRYPDGTEVLLGRRCAVKATGYAAGAVEREATAAARRDVLAARMATVQETFPLLVAARDKAAAAYMAARDNGVNPETLPYSAAASLLGTVVAEDSWWGGRGWTAYDSWSEYLTVHAPKDLL